MLALALLASGVGWPMRSAAAAPSSQSSIGLQARAGFGDQGDYIIGEWFPVHVTLSNASGGPSTHVRLEVDSIGTGNTPVGTYVREVDLPSPSRKEVTLYLYGDTF